MPLRDRSPRGAGELAAVLTGAALLGLLTGLLGSSQHLARHGVAGVLLPLGLLLALLLVLLCDVSLALLGAALGRSGRRSLRPGPLLLAVAVGRVVSLAVLILPTEEGDVVLTGLLSSTAWMLLAVLLPSFLAPLATAGAVRAAGPVASVGPAARPAGPAGSAASAGAGAPAPVATEAPVVGS